MPTTPPTGRVRAILRVLVAALLALPAPATAQERTPDFPAARTWYGTATVPLEWLFTSPLLDVAGNDRGAVTRFTAVLNMEVHANYDLGRAFGLFWGFNVRNVGFVYEVPETDLRYKYRVYTAGLPLGFKVGDMRGTQFFAGYGLEVPLHYKEKRFLNEKRQDRFGVWFSGRAAGLFHSVAAGVQLGRGPVLTVRYYLNNFHDRDFTETLGGGAVRPYGDLQANILAFSLTFGLFDGSRFRDDDPRNRPIDVRARR